MSIGSSYNSNTTENHTVGETTTGDRSLVLTTIPTNLTVTTIEFNAYIVHTC